MFGSIWTSQVWKKDLQFSLRLSLRKSQISYKRLTSLQNLEIKTTVKKKIKKKIFEDPKSLLLRSPWVGKGGVARTISTVMGTSFSLVGFWGTAKGMVTSGATPLLASVSFSATPYCWGSSDRLPETREALAGLPFLSSATSEEVSALELAEPGTRIVGG